MDNSATRERSWFVCKREFPCLFGSPGEGKSSVVESLAESLEMRVEVVIGSVRDATDFAGLPMRSDDGWSSLRLRGRAVASTGRRRWSFSINTAPPSTQAAMMRQWCSIGRSATSCCRRRWQSWPPRIPWTSPRTYASSQRPLRIASCTSIGRRRRPAGSKICSGWRAGGEVEVVPGDLGVHAATWRGRVAAFIDHFPDCLRQVPDDDVDRGRAWPSPRTWDLCHQVCRSICRRRWSRCQAATGQAEAAGEAAALELLAFVEDEEAVDAATLCSMTLIDGRPRNAMTSSLLLPAQCVRELERADQPALWSAAWRWWLPEFIHMGRPDLAVLTALSLVELRRPTWEQPDLTKIKQHLESLGYLLVDDRLDEWWM